MKNHSATRLSRKLVRECLNYVGLIAQPLDITEIIAILERINISIQQRDGLMRLRYRPLLSLLEDFLRLNRETFDTGELGVIMKGNVQRVCEVTHG